MYIYLHGRNSPSGRVDSTPLAKTMRSIIFCLDGEVLQLRPLAR